MRKPMMSDLNKSIESIKKVLCEDLTITTKPRKGQFIIGWLFLDDIKKTVYVVGKKNRRKR